MPKDHLLKHMQFLIKQKENKDIKITGARQQNTIIERDPSSNNYSAKGKNRPMSGFSTLRFHGGKKVSWVHIP